MLGFAILIGFLILGELLHSFMGIPLPGNVMGLILFTGSLFAGVVKLQWVERTADFFVKHLQLFFIPVIVAVMTTAGLIKEELMAASLGVLLSTFLVLIATGFTVKILERQ